MTDQNAEQVYPYDDDRNSQRTTSDVHHDAEEALKLFAALQHMQGEATATQGTGHFSAGMSLQLKVKNVDAVMVVQLDEEDKVIGRADPATGDAPEVDLAPFAAYQAGISRRHAVLRCVADELLIIDMGSRNGTYVNGKKTQPHQPLKLHDGDEMRLGKMALQIHFKR